MIYGHEVMKEIEDVTGFDFGGVVNFDKIFYGEVEAIEKRNKGFRRKEPNSMVYNEALKRITEWIRNPEEPQFTFKWFSENRYPYVLMMLLIHEQNKKAEEIKPEEIKPKAKKGKPDNE
jgi:hypothetical protein